MKLLHVLQPVGLGGLAEHTIFYPAALGISDAQMCSVYTAGSTDTSEDNDNTDAAMYVNLRTQEEAKCSGTVYAWHYCYYPDNSETNLQVAFGVFSFINNSTLFVMEATIFSSWICEKMSLLVTM